MQTQQSQKNTHHYSKPRRNIFERLDERGIAYAVVVSRFTMRADIDRYINDYCIVIDGFDYNHLGLKSFRRSDDYVNVYERNLSPAEVRWWKENKLDQMEKVIHNQYGRVYEIQGKSFRKTRIA
jgi:hypothetical protein